MGYTPAQMDAATNALVAAIHGLHPDVARAWATAEQGVNYNILGVTHIVNGHQVLYSYSSWAQGAEAAWQNLQASYYAGVRSSLSGTSQQQAAAIIASPWNHPYYSTGAGATLLRQIASALPPVSTGAKVTIVDPGVDIYDQYGHNTGKHISRATYNVGQRKLVNLAWQYPILDHMGWWIRPNRYTRFWTAS